MRAIELHFQAFGPYHDKQSINFNTLGDESIFLITGPTGSGKTTIFDSICYALYGRASGSDRDQDSLRSHFAEPGFLTEVTFVFSLKNKTYKVHRSPKQERMRKRGEGLTEVPAKASIYVLNESDNWELLSSRIATVNEIIEDLLRFDYDQFSKMVLIPQGEFRKLITENSREREQILQRIFQTHFYREISERFKEQAKELREKATIQQQEINMQFARIDQEDNIYLNDEIENKDKIKLLATSITNLKKQLKDIYKTKANFLEKRNKLREELEYSKQLDYVFNELSKFKKERELLLKNKTTYQVKKSKLEKALEANLIKPYYDNAVNRKLELQKQQQKLDKLNEDFTKYKELYTTTQQKYQEAMARSDERTELSREIERKNEEKKIFEQYQLEIQARKKIQSDIVQLEKTLERQNKEITEKEAELTKLEETLASETELIKEKHVKETKLNKFLQINDLTDRLVKYQSKLTCFRNQYKDAQNTLQQTSDYLEKLESQLELLESEKDKHYAMKLRADLKHGEPCLVCGSINHVQSKVVEEHSSFSEEEIKSLKEKIDTARKEYEKQSAHCTQIETEGKGISNQVIDLTNEICKRLEINELTDDTVQLIPKECTAIEKALQKLDEKLYNLSLQKEIYQQSKIELDTFKQTFEQKREELNKYKNRYTEKDTVIQQLKNRLSIENIKTIDVYNDQLATLQKEYEQQMKAWENIEALYLQTREQKNQLKTEIDTTKRFVEDLNERYVQDQSQFNRALANSPFSNLEQLKSAFLSVEEQESVKNYIEEYSDKLNRLTHQINKYKEEISGKERPDINRLESIITSYDKKLEEIQQNTLKLESKKETSENVHKKVLDLMNLKEKIEKEYYIVGDLAETTQGNNAYRLSFERYVLSTFLDEILIQANIRLARMTDYRFELIRSKEVARHGAQSGLDLEVIDYHTGKKRSVKTLSGGEGFKAALSLALGLADVVQEHTGGVQMETMFIDEGFGTLDDVSLQQAIECLKDLQDSNRLLGIISHVPQLKHEIHAKLEITPSNKGSSLNFVFSGE